MNQFDEENITPFSGPEKDTQQFRPMALQLMKMWGHFKTNEAMSVNIWAI